MGESLKEILRMERKMGKGLLNGQMVINILGLGKMGNNMGKGSGQVLETTLRDKGSG